MYYAHYPTILPMNSNYFLLQHFASHVAFVRTLQNKRTFRPMSTISLCYSLLDTLIGTHTENKYGVLKGPKKHSSGLVWQYMVTIFEMFVLGVRSTPTT